MRIRNILKALELCNWSPAILFRMAKCAKFIPSGCNILEQAFMFRTLLSTRASGTVLECGSYKGSTTAVLSIACKIGQRRLHVFDSFEGLPTPAENDARHRLVQGDVDHVYQAGAWAGSLDEVRCNVSRYGEISVCEFHKGFFEETLPSFQEPTAFAFCDVDLRSSLETCLLYIWPLLVDGGVFFSHEAQHYTISELFFDSGWWNRNLHCDPPGLVGAGSGLGLIDNKAGFADSGLGFTVKNARHLADSIELGKAERYVVSVAGGQQSELSGNPDLPAA